MTPEEAKRIALAVACIVIEDYGYELIKNWKTDEGSLQMLQTALTELRDELEERHGLAPEQEKEILLSDETLRKLRAPSLFDKLFEDE